MDHPWEPNEERKHDVPLSEKGLAVVLSAPRVAGSEFVFTTTGRTPISGYSGGKESLDAVAAKIADEQGIAAPAAWRLHDLRRTAASGMARMGIPVHIIEAVLNHRSGQISGVAAIYNRHSYFPEKRHALAAWASHVMGLVNGPAASNVVKLRGGHEFALQAQP